MLACLRAGQRDGRRRRQANDDFGWWVLFLAVSGPNFMKFGDDVGDHSQFPSRLPIASIKFQVFALKIAIGLRSR